MSAGVGALAACFEVFNTAIGWHVASGRWILQHLSVPSHDPFALGGPQPWIDHEWLFQVMVSIVDAVAGPSGMVVLRMVLVAAMAAIACQLGRWSGLRPESAVLLSVVCVLGARMRFFIRPELVTMLVVLLVVAAALGLRGRRRILAVTVLSGVGVNAHGAALVAVVLVAAVAVGRMIDSWRSAGLERRGVRDELVLVAAAAAVTLLNPAGWRLWTVPLQLTELVGLEAIPNPEWLAATPQRVPAFYGAAAVVALLMVAKERRFARWLPMIAVTILALRYVRNIGLFFVMLPVLVAPAAAALPLFGSECSVAQRRVVRALSVLLVLGSMVWFVIMPWPRLGLGLAEDRYPVAACDFLDANRLLDRRLYNDVAFGGYLLWRAYPPLQVFLDDRNEVHADRLLRIWSIFQASDTSRWEAMLAEYQLDVALVRYHQPLLVRDPTGRALGWRGFSALWFQPRTWALVYFDDVAMVFVRRSVMSTELAKLEYRWIRPDDLSYLTAAVSSGAVPPGPMLAEVQRRLTEGPASQRASDLAEALLEAAGR